LTKLLDPIPPNFLTSENKISYNITHRSTMATTKIMSNKMISLCVRTVRNVIVRIQCTSKNILMIWPRRTIER